MKMDITLLCCTHGRAHILPEAVECFRRQAGISGLKVEMLILNDCLEQPISCDVPGVRVVNMPKMCGDVSDKLNVGFQESRGTWVANLDDDDISLPFRLAHSWNYMKLNPDILAFRQARAWYWNKGVIVKRPFNLFFGSSFINREYYFKCGGATPDAPADLSAWNKILAAGQGRIIIPSAEETHFIYRWGGMGYHYSGRVVATAEEAFENYRKGTLSDPQFIPGIVKIIPEWKMDYERQVRLAIRDGVGDKA